jgi:uncharacterized protein (TIGR03435 family)
MTECIVRERKFSTKALLIAAGLTAVALPFILSQAAAEQNNAATQTADATAGIPEFAVSTVKPNMRNDGRWKLNPSHEGWSAMGVSVHKLIQEAYGIYEDDRILGEANWVNSLKYDIEAKVDEADFAAFQKLDYNQRRLMLQALLADRFKLAAHRETKERPIYALILAKKGSKLQETPPDHVPTRTIKGSGGTVTRSRPGQLTAEWMTTDQLAKMLSQRVDRQIVDKTGLTGHYDFKLDWAPDDGAAQFVNAPNSTSLPPDPSGPSIFTAVQEQLGLKLEPQEGPVEVIVIDHVEQPSAN